MHSAELSKHVARQNFSPCIPANAQNTAISDHHGGQHGYGGERQIVRLSAVTDIATLVR